MSKVALLVGVSEYGSNLEELPAALKDIESLQKVLKNPDLGDFEEVVLLTNPSPTEMQLEIEKILLENRKPDDLVLLYFSGHGIKDASGKLYFATRSTQRNSQGELFCSTAVSSTFVQECMTRSRSKRQVIILDCCFSGAFAQGMTAKGEIVDFKAQLGGKGRVVLTSSTSTQYSFGNEKTGLSVYTHFLVKGIETGDADLDGDGYVSVDELHEYAKSHISSQVENMRPEIYSVREGYKIHLTKVPPLKINYLERKDLAKYATEAEEFIRNRGISHIGEKVLEQRAQELGLLPSEAVMIRNSILEATRKYQDKLGIYADALAEAIRSEGLLSIETRSELRKLQAVLGLRDEDVIILETKSDMERWKLLLTNRQAADLNVSSNDLCYYQVPQASTGQVYDGNIAALRSILIQQQLEQEAISQQSTENSKSWSKGQVPKTRLRMGFSYDPRLNTSSSSTPNENLDGSHISSISHDELFSEKGLDYRPLRDLLRKKLWKQADLETANMLLLVFGKDLANWLQTEDVERCPCADLNTIGMLWKSYSNDRFGFNIQKQIWQSEDVGQDWAKFASFVGWTNGESLKNYKDLTYNLNAPHGHLPSWGIVSSAGKKFGFLTENGLWSQEVRVGFAKRLITCDVCD